MKKISIYFNILLFILLTAIYSSPQIKVYERPNLKYNINNGLFLSSEKRIRYELNGTWQLSFNGGEKFSEFKVPLCYEFKNEVIYKRKFSVPENIISNYNFIFVCEGMNYESEIRINGDFINKHTGGYTSVVTQIEENIVKTENEIIISLHCNLNTHSTIPLGSQVNFPKNYAGIYGDIYILAVPKVSVFENYISYNIEGDSFLKIINKSYIYSTNFDSKNSEYNDLRLKSYLIRKSDSSIASESEKVKIIPENYKIINVETKLSLKNSDLWTPENPNLYYLKIVVYNGDNILDELYQETGFCNFKIKTGQSILNNRPYPLKGINYYAETPSSGIMIDYSEIESDLKIIKNIGFNSIRVPGKCASPYLVNACNRNGLFLFQEIPFNEVPANLMKDENYIESALNYLENIVKRDKNSVSIIAWGLGNNFDVTNKSSVGYITSAKEIITKYDTRPFYYTTRNYFSDSCASAAGFRGLNFYTDISSDIKNILSNLKTGNCVNFISSIGVNIDNSNKNGYSDPHSNEFQSKFFIDIYKFVNNFCPATFISSYCDWNAEDPILKPLIGNNNYLRTDGILDINRRTKQSAAFVKHILNNEDISKLSEGKAPENKSFIFIISGIVVLLICSFTFSRYKSLKDGIGNILFKPSSHFSYMKEQVNVQTGLTIFLSIIINISIALYFSTIFYFFREDNFFDMLSSYVFLNDDYKILFSEYLENPIKIVILLSVLFIIIQYILAFFLYILSIFSREHPKFKNIFYVVVWSALLMILLLPVGTVLYKLTSKNINFLIISIYLYLILLILYLYRVINGIRILFDSRRIKTYFWGIVFTVFFFGSIYYFFYVHNNLVNLLSLIKSYN